MIRLRVERRALPSSWASAAAPVLALAAALLAGAVMLAIAGLNPLTAYVDLVSDPFGSVFGWTETIVKTIPLILTGLAVLLPARMRLWNIGAEGQLQCGAIAATWVAVWTPLGHSPVAIPALLLAGMAAGALWCLIPAILRAYLSVNETITTLLMNYIALLLVDYLIYGPWQDPAGRGFPLSAPFPPAAKLPLLIPGTRVHLGLALALAAVAATAFVLNRTRWGLEIRIIGDNPMAARYAGISLTRNIVLVMGVAGALAGLAGASEVSAIAGRLERGISPGYGYTAILVAWLARLSPLAIVLVALLLGALFVGGDGLQISLGLPIAVVYMLQGLIFFFVLASETLATYRMTTRGRSPGRAGPSAGAAVPP